MSDASMPNQAAEPDRDTASSQQAQVHTPPNPGGSAVLDANVAAGVSTNPHGEPISDPIATNFSTETGTGDAKTADVSTVAGPYSGESQQSDKGSVHLQNNPNVPDSDAEKTQPDTDQIALPINSEVNLQD